MNKLAAVLKIEGEYAVVEAMRSDACSACHGKCIGCGKPIRTKVKNTLGAKAGDMVELYSDSSRILFLCAMVFLFPIIAAVIVFAAVFYFYGNDAVYISALAFLASFIGACFYFNEKKDLVSVKMIRIVETNQKQSDKK